VSAYILPADLQSAKFFTEEERAYAGNYFLTLGGTASEALSAVQRFKVDNITTMIEVPDDTTVKGEKEAVIEVENVDSGKRKTSVIEEEFEWPEVIRGKRTESMFINADGHVW